MSLTLTPPRLQRLVPYLKEEYSIADKGRSSRVQLWQKYITRYESKSVRKNFPWRGSSSVHVPLVAIFYDSIKARIMNALRAQDRLVIAEALSEDPIPGILDPNTGQPITWRTIAELAEQYFTYEISPSGEVNLVDALDKFLDEILLLGTGILKPIFQTTLLKDFSDDGKTSTTVAETSNINFVVPPLESILFPPGYPDFKRIPWISHTYNLRPSEILNRILSDGWNEANIRTYLSSNGSPSSRVSELTETQAQVEGVSEELFYSNDEHPLAETWLRFDLDGDGKERRILVDHTTQEPFTVFRIIPWPYSHGQLPFIKANYISRRRRAYGMGIPERIEDLDEAYSTAFNHMADNVTLANTRAWSVRRDSPAARARDDIYPGMKMPRDDKDDIIPLQMGEIYPSIFEEINVIRDIAERVCKITDYNLGRESQAMGRQSTATATLALLQESGQYFDNITRDIRKALNEALCQWLELLAQMKPLARVQKVLGPRAQPFLAALTLPPGDLRNRIGIRIAFSSDAATRELARQEEQAKLALMKDYYTNLLEMAQLRFNPEIPPQIAMLTDEIAKDAELRIRRLLNVYGEYYSTDTLPSWDKVMSSAPAESRPGLRDAIQRQQIAVSSGLAPQPGMESPQGGSNGTQKSTPPKAPSGSSPSRP